MMLVKLALICFSICILTLIVDGSQDLLQDILLQMENDNGTTLSRKRRYLKFPAGSSFQVVYCLTYPSVAVGSYFVFGHTAALAWELPSTSLFFDKRDFDKKKEEDEPAETTTVAHNEHERIDGGEFFYDEFNNEIEGDTENFHTIYNNPFVDFAKRPGYSPVKFGYSTEGAKVRRRPSLEFERPYPKNGPRYNPWKSHMRLNVAPKYYQIHRRTRRDLYGKIETFLNALNLDGKSCLLKAICEFSTSPDEKGTFMEELFKAIFRVKPHDKHQDEDEFDLAANPETNCTELYPNCRGSVRNVQILARK